LEGEGRVGYMQVGCVQGMDTAEHLLMRPVRTIPTVGSKHLVALFQRSHLSGPVRGVSQSYTARIRSPQELLQQKFRRQRKVLLNKACELSSMCDADVQRS